MFIFKDTAMNCLELFLTQSSLSPHGWLMDYMDYSSTERTLGDWKRALKQQSDMKVSVLLENLL